MAHPNSRPYSLPFPNEVQRMQISSYSSLANALGTDPGYASRQRRWPLLTKCDVITDTKVIYSSEPPANNPSYPYPYAVRNDMNPDACARISASNGWYPSNATMVLGENSDQNDSGRFLLRYDRLPQPFFVSSDTPYGYQAGVMFPAIHFLREENKEPYSLWNLLTMDTMPDLVDGDIPILVQSTGRWIKIKLIWPGYSRYPFEKRIPIKRDKFIRWIRNEGAVVEPGQEHWAATGVPEGTPAMWKECVITSLQHRTGSVWQPEIYYPRKR